MEQTEELVKDIGKIKDTKDRILVRVLCIAVASLFAISVGLYKGNSSSKDQDINYWRSEYDTCVTDNRNYRDKKERETEERDKRLNDKIEQRDSLIYKLKNAIRK